MTQEQLEEFAKEYNALMNKYKISIVNVYGPMVMVKDNKFVAEYSAMRGRHKDGHWTISVPWGG